jgi:hypothetical protein
MMSDESERRLFARTRELTEAAMKRVERHRQDIAERDRERAMPAQQPVTRHEPERPAVDSDRRAG